MKEEAKLIVITRASEVAKYVLEHEKTFPELEKELEIRSEWIKEATRLLFWDLLGYEGTTEKLSDKWDKEQQWDDDIGIGLARKHKFTWIDQINKMLLDISSVVREKPRTKWLDSNIINLHDITTIIQTPVENRSIRPVTYYKIDEYHEESLLHTVLESVRWKSVMQVMRMIDEKTDGKWVDERRYEFMGLDRLDAYVISERRPENT